MKQKSKLFYGYVVTAASFIILVVAGGLFNTIGVFFTPIQNEFGWSRAAISLNASLAMIIFGILGIFMGRLGDRCGPRLVLGICGVFYGASYILSSTASSLWQLYLFWGVMTGIAVSATDVVLLPTIARWFVKKRGAMSGIVKVGTGIGLLILPLFEAHLIGSYGWRTTMLVLGIMATLIILPVSRLLKRDPGEVGQLPDGAPQDPLVKVDRLEEGLTLRQAMATRQLWTLWVAYFFLLFSTTSVISHIVPRAVDSGVPVTEAATVLSTIGGASILGRLLMGNVGDRMGYKKGMVVCFAVLVVALAWLQTARELWMLQIFGVVYGFAHGGFFALISPLTAALFGTRSHGAIFGTVMLAGSLSGSIGPVLAGYTFDVTGSYQLIFLSFVFAALTGLILTASLKPAGKGTEPKPALSSLR